MNRLEKRLLGAVARASQDFALLEPNDRVMVCLSGGKDSHAMLYLLREIPRRAPFDFSLVAVNLDQGQPGFPKQVLPEYLEREGYEFRIITRGHLFHRDRQGAGGEDVLLAVLPPAPRHPVQRGARSRRDEDRPRPPSRRRDRDAALEPALLRPDEGHAAAPTLGRRPQHRHPPAGLRERAGPRGLRRRKEFPIIPCDLCGSQDNLQRKRVKS